MSFDPVSLAAQITTASGFALNKALGNVPAAVTTALKASDPMPQLTALKEALHTHADAGHGGAASHLKAVDAAIANLSRGAGVAVKKVAVSADLAATLGAVKPGTGAPAARGTSPASVEEKKPEESDPDKESKKLLDAFLASFQGRDVTPEAAMAAFFDKQRGFVKAALRTALGGAPAAAAAPAAVRPPPPPFLGGIKRPSSDD